MKISGLQKLSLVDFEGKISATIFLSGCNFACPFCHNSSLVKNTELEISQSDVFDYLIKRKGLLEAVCISGGEPTLNPDLPEFIAQIKKLGYIIKLDTNGTNLNMLKYLVENKLIDYVAMDIKNSINSYNLTTGRDIDTNSIKHTIQYIMSCGIDYEFRTTLVEELFTMDDIKLIASLIKGAKRYYLQKFEDSGNCIQSGLHPVDRSQAEQYMLYLQKYIKNTNLRGY